MRTVGERAVGSGAAPIEIALRGEDGRDLGAIAIDSTVAGRARGGLRISPRADATEVRPLARAMTLKYGFLGLPQGGAKGAARGDPEAPSDERRRTLSAFARAAAPILRSGLYLPDADLGTRNADIRRVLETAGVQPRRREWRGERSGEWTALTTFAALRQAAQRVGTPVAGARVAIEGFGAVGGALAGLLAAAGARIVAVSTSRGGLHDPGGLDMARLLAAAARDGSGFVERFADRRIAASEVPVLPLDYLCPCAVGETIHEGNADDVAARAVVPGANLPCTPAAERRLAERGIVCVPDFLANCGGALGGTMEFAGVDDAGIRAFVEGEIGPRIGRVLDLADTRGVPPRAVAEEIALAHHAEVRRAAEAGGARVLGAALELHRRSWLPARLVGIAAVGWFRRAVAEVP
ncbi:MAG TPA: Glu/Leu/Phe/Val dehydrogenase dimerization domain-containing protein [Gemmatimonadota bacterium]|nr:Glu/Leu/Phe/Val dehydrogenase dimerization domain-containing protein [Gemmatimonadota bacterium]